MHKGLTRLTFVLVCLAAISVAYYFGLYLPRYHDAEPAEQQRNADLEHARRCDKDAKQFYSNFVKEWSLVFPGRGWLEPEWHFNRKLNTCVASISFFSSTGNSGYTEESVMDVYSNHTIINTCYTIENVERKTFCGTDPKQYSEEKEKLFSE